MGIRDRIRDLFPRQTASTSFVDSETIEPESGDEVEPAQASRDHLHEYWRRSEQAPSRYAEADPKRSEYLVALLKDYVTPEQRILELGTNAGRNLHYLRQAGFVNLEGVEISPAAVDELRRRFPDLDDVVVRVGPIEEHLPPYGDREFECVFTMAVLEHVHYDSDWVLQHVARVGKSLVTIEEETWVSERHFPRDYRRVFESLGMTQVYERPVDELFVPEELGRSRGITARVFVHSD